MREFTNKIIKRTKNSIKFSKLGKRFESKHTLETKNFKKPPESDEYLG